MRPVQWVTSAGPRSCAQRPRTQVGQNGEIRERRQQLRHPVYQKPELLAEKPNEVWSWDITKLMGPAKWSYFYLYVILDIFSRRVVGWCIADTESATLFKGNYSPLSFVMAGVGWAFPPGHC
jgi:putative transposase